MRLLTTSVLVLVVALPLSFARAHTETGLPAIHHLLAESDLAIFGSVHSFDRNLIPNLNVLKIDIKESYKGTGIGNQIDVVVAADGFRPSKHFGVGEEALLFLSEIKDPNRLAELNKAGLQATLEVQVAMDSETHTSIADFLTAFPLGDPYPVLSSGRAESRAAAIAWASDYFSDATSFYEYLQYASSVVGADADVLALAKASGKANLSSDDRALLLLGTRGMARSFEAAFSQYVIFASSPTFSTDLIVEGLASDSSLMRAAAVAVSPIRPSSDVVAQLELVVEQELSRPVLDQLPIALFSIENASLAEKLADRIGEDFSPNHFHLLLLTKGADPNPTRIADLLNAASSRPSCIDRDVAMEALRTVVRQGIYVDDIRAWALMQPMDDDQTCRTALVQLVGVLPASADTRAFFQAAATDAGSNRATIVSSLEALLRDCSADVSQVLADIAGNIPFKPYGEIINGILADWDYYGRECR